MLEEEEDGEVVMLGLDEDEGQGEGEGEGVCYTELKPSTTLLVPLELAEEALAGGHSHPHQPLQLLDRDALGSMVPADATAPPAGGFSLMLEAEEEEEGEGEVGERGNQAMEEVGAGGELEQLMELPQAEQRAQTPEPVAQGQVDTPAPQEEVAKAQSGAQMADEEALENTGAEDAVLLAVSADQKEEGKSPPGPPEETEAEPEQLSDTREAGRVEQEVQQDPSEHVEAAEVMEEKERLASTEEDLAEESPAQMETQAEEPNKNLQQEPDQAVEEEVVREPEKAEQPQAAAAAAEEAEEEEEEAPGAEAAAAAAEVKEEEEEEMKMKNTGKGRSIRMSERTATAAEMADATYDLSPPVTTRKTSSRKNVTFISPVAQAEEFSANEGGEEQAEADAPPRRSTRSGKQLPDVQVPVTPRRRTRRTEPEAKEKLAEEEEAPSASTTVNPKAGASKRPTPQKATPKKGGRRTRSEADTQEAFEEQPSVEVLEMGRRSTRKTRNTSMLEAPNAPAVPPETEAPRSASGSPARVTRSSARGVSLSLDSFQDATAAVLITPPRSRRKTRAATAEKAVPDAIPPSGAAAVVRRLTRSRHFQDVEEEGEEQKEELGIMDTTVELVPGTPLGDALMERLQGEAGGQVAGVGGTVTEIIRGKRRTTRAAAALLTSVVEPEDAASEQANVDANASAAAEPPESAASPSRRRTRANKAPEPEASMEANSFTFTPTRRTRGKS